MTVFVNFNQQKLSILKILRIHNFTLSKESTLVQNPVDVRRYKHPTITAID